MVKERVACLLIAFCALSLTSVSLGQDKQSANDRESLKAALGERGGAQVSKPEHVLSVLTYLREAGEGSPPESGSFLDVFIKELEKEPYDPENILTSEEFCSNYLRMMNKTTRIVGPALDTREVQQVEFNCCVAVGRRSGGKETYFGTGTLVSKRLVLTAGHVAVDGPGFVFFGLNVNDSQGSLRVDVEDVIDDFGYDADQNHKNDIALLVLKNDVPSNWKPAPIAPIRAADNMTYIRAVGFGWAKDLQRVEQKRLTDIGVYSKAVTRRQEDLYGGHEGMEFIAADPHGNDTCKGDSGGPSFTLFKNKWALVGVTSRGVAKQCGKGGFYVRVGNYIPQIQSQAQRLGEQLNLID